MTSFMFSPFVGVLFFLFLSAITLVTACLMGVIEFKWKTPPPTPLPQRAVSNELDEITAYVQEHVDPHARVDLVDEVFQIGVSDECELVDAEIITQLTSKFPRCIFGIRHCVVASQ